MAGALAVLIAVILSLSLVGAPGGEEKNTDADASSVLVGREQRPHTRVTRAESGANATAAVYSQGVRRRTADLTARRQQPRMGMDQPRPGGIAHGVNRRSAMRAALLLLVAGDGAKNRVR
jgi:hypothetical protein